MSFQVFFPLRFISLLCFLSVVLIKIQPSLANPDLFRSCGNFFRCGNITAGYPFWGGDRGPVCGHPQLELKCENDMPSIMIGVEKYRVLKIDSKEQVLKILLEDYFKGLCPQTNTTNDPGLFDFANEYGMFNLTYGCSVFPVKFNCYMKDVINYMDGFLKFTCGITRSDCNTIVRFPVYISLLAAKWGALAPQQDPEEGFEMKWKFSGCGGSSSSCGFNFTKYTASPDGQSSSSPGCSAPSAGPESKGNNNSKKAVISIAAGSAAAVILGLVFFCIIRRRRKTAAYIKSGDLAILPSRTSGTPTTTSTTTTATNSRQSITSYLYSSTDLEKGSSYFGAQVFSCSELEEATDNFHPSKQLGDGGFGAVYLGLLRDGRLVAVKRLYENNFKRVQQFMNEVEILTKLQHKNLVKLYGCTSRQSRELLLVYEYIPNGTVADHLHNRQPNSCLLPWPVRLSIAIETADALAYLHATDVIHRDVKTNNILLENNFRVKVADFGLSRLLPTDVTHVSTAPQGTPGYVDPEYFQYYKLTDKSDVYSFGVVLIELISGLAAVDTSRHQYHINLSNMAVNKIQNQALNELVDPSLGFEKDYAVRNMVTSVAELAFRCLQQDREMRPTMKEVLEILRQTKDSHLGTHKAEVVDIHIADDAVLLKKDSPPLSPEYESGTGTGTEKWVSSSNPSSSF